MIALYIFCASSPGLEVEITGDKARVDTGKISFELDLRRAVLQRVVAGEKALVEGNVEPLLFATLMESEGYDGVRDTVDARFIASDFICDGLEVESTPAVFTASGTGSLRFAGGDAIGFELSIKARDNSSGIELVLALRSEGEFSGRFVREVGVRQPLALDLRKRVVQAADQGLRFDTRHYYQFHAHTGPLAYPDYNIWRRFYIDQDSERSYRIWRSEGADTAGLHVFDGRRAAGWLTMYDMHGGALFGYRGISRRAPKLLYADASEGGTGVFYIYGPTQPAFSLRDPRLSAAVFGEPHRMDMIFFAGEEAEVKPDETLAGLWGLESLPSDGPTRFEPVADEVELWGAGPAPAALSPIVSGGIPVPRGAMREVDQARLFVRGREVPCQFEALGYWPDRSVKWLLLIFPLEDDGGFAFAPGAGSGDEVEFRVTLREGDDVPCRLVFGGDARAGAIEDGLRVTEDSADVTVDTGSLRMTLSEGAAWMKSAIYDGREMLGASEQPQAFADFLRPGSYEESRTHAGGLDDPGPVHISRIDVEKAGPLRAVVRLEGEASCSEGARVIMRLEFYKGRSYVRLLHSVELLHMDPRVVFMRSLGLRIPLALDVGERTFALGGQGGAVEAEGAPLLGLRQNRHLNYEAWRLGDGYREIVDAGSLSRGWLSVADEAGGVTVVQRDMWREGPKELLYRADAGAIEVGFWPESAPLMDMRRYSNYGHPSQGEAGFRNPHAVEREYYPAGSVAGVSRSHETLIHFHGTGLGKAERDSVVADFQSRPLVYAGWDWYAATRITYPQPHPGDEKFVRFNANLDNVASWFLFHQKAWGWYGFWDYGDVRHAFRTGYGRVIPPDDLTEILAGGRENMEKVPFRFNRSRLDYFTQGDWAFDNGRWGWGNTEGLVNHFMSHQYLRTGRRDIFFFVEANARHVRDVDARHSGRWFGRGTRHGVQHWSDGNHEERQTTFTEQRFHYFLTGEHRTREWSHALTDGHYLKSSLRVHAAHSGRTYGLLFNWEITGDPGMGRLIKRYFDIIAQPEGIDISPSVVFPDVERRGGPGMLNSQNMFFHSFGGMHALLEYYNITGDERMRDSIIKMAEAYVDSPSKRKEGLLRKAVAFAARYSPERERFMPDLLDFCKSPNMFQQVPANRAHWTGPTAFFRSGISGGLFWMSDMAYVMGALDAEPAPGADVEADILDKETREPEPEPRAPRGSWQVEYDRPEFADYLKDPTK